MTYTIGVGRYIPTGKGGVLNQELKLKIDGMHCTSCARLIEGMLLDTEGISSVKVDYESGTGALFADLDRLSKEDLLDHLAREGYESHILGGNGEGKDSGLPAAEAASSGGPLDGKPASKVGFQDTIAAAASEKQASNETPAQEKNKELNPDRRVGLSLSGMHCASCAGLIEHSLNKVAGVKQAGVNFAAEKAYVTFDAAVVSPDGLIEAVKRAGYKAELVDETDSEYESRKREREMAGYFNKFLFSLAFSLPMLYFMLLDFFKWLPGANSFPPYFGIVSFLLATPVQFFAGAGFYKGAWSSLRMKTFNMDSLIAIGTSTAYFYSVVNLISHSVSNTSLIGLNGAKIPNMYFETAAFLITL